MKFKFYTGNEELKKEWIISRKLDGVHVVIYDHEAFSKAGNKLHNMDFAAHFLDDGHYELFDTDWATSVSACKTHKGEPVKLSKLYSLEPLDPRLWEATITNPTDEDIRVLFDKRVALGDEGLIITRGKKRYKLKEEVTVDVRVTGMIEGTGRLEGKLGSLVTEYGKIGTGFDDEMRRLLWDSYRTEGSIVEAKCQGFTKERKMRHARFIRSRWDKNTENLEGN